MTKKISITQFSPRLQRAINKEVSSFTNNRFKTVARNKILESDDQDIVDTSDNSINHYKKYFKSSSSKAQFSKDIKLIVDLIEKNDLMDDATGEQINANVHSFTFVIEQDAKGKLECIFEVNVLIVGDAWAFRSFQTAMADSFRGKLKLCKYITPYKFDGIDVFDEDEEDEDESEVVTASGTFGFRIPCDLVDTSKYNLKS